MTNQERLMLTNLGRERQQQLARQLAVNADIRRRWVEADHVEAQPSRVANDGAVLSDYFSRDRFPFRMLKAAAKISPPVMPRIASLFFAWRSKRAPAMVGAGAKPVSALPAFFSNLFNIGQQYIHGQPILNAQSVISHK